MVLVVVVVEVKLAQVLTIISIVRAGATALVALACTGYVECSENKLYLWNPISPIFEESIHSRK